MIGQTSVLRALPIALAMLVAVVAAKEPKVIGGQLAFELPDLDGRMVKSSDSVFDGRVLYVTLWGTWCPPCISEIPTLNDLQARYAGQGFVVVAIAFERASSTTSRQEALREFAGKHGIEYLILDGGPVSEFSSALPMLDDVKGLPIEIVIDRTGLVVDCRNSFGYKKRWARNLEKRLRALLDVE